MKNLKRNNENGQNVRTAVDLKNYCRKDKAHFFAGVISMFTRDIAFQDAEIFSKSHVDVGLPLQELRARGLRLPGSQTSGQPPDPELEQKVWELGALG